MSPSPSPAKQRRVFLVDDHPLVRESLSVLLERQKDLEICGHADDPAAAYDAIKRLSPDVAIVDLTLESGSGLELIKQLQELDAPPLVLVLSMHDELVFGERVLRAGAQGYIMKRAAPKHVVEAVRQILAGCIYMSPELQAHIARRALHGKGTAENPLTLLSDREMDVFRMLGQGAETAKIAETLGLSPKTVRVYYDRIKLKLGLSSPNEMVREAVKLTGDRLSGL